MITNRKSRLVGTLAVIVLCATARIASSAVAVDGMLGDWGITLGSNNKLSFNGGLVNNAPSGSYVDNFLNSGSRLYYHSEDSNDAAGDSGSLGPYAGGQNYDGEYMGVKVVGDKLSLAIATGQRLDNGLQRYSPGDLRIVTDRGIFGIEMGGGQGDMSSNGGEFGLGSDGTTYCLNSSGFTKSTISHGSSPTDRTAGSIWLTETGDWILDPIANLVGTQLNHSTLEQSNRVGSVDAYIYNHAESLGEHAFIEMVLDLDWLLGSFSDIKLLSVFWSPSCDNDELIVSFGPEGLVYHNPEASSLVIWAGAGGLAALCYRRRRNRITLVNSA